MNKKLGEKFEISEVELVSTVDACKSLLLEGEDIDTGAAATQVRQPPHPLCSHRHKHDVLVVCCAAGTFGLGWVHLDVSVIPHTPALLLFLCVDADGRRDWPVPGVDNDIAQSSKNMSPSSKNLLSKGINVKNTS